MYAVIIGFEDIINLLVARGANVHIRNEVRQIHSAYVDSMT